jgi:imidazole glycerol-phosphate synthase subunit HisH
MIIVIDYGVGNVGSIRKMLRRDGWEVAVSADPELIERADGLVLPGVGAFDDAVTRLRATGLVPLIERRVFEHGTPLLGICLGMQMLGRRSDEGTLAGLGWIDAETVAIAPGADRRVPHIGWNVVTPENGSPLFAGMAADDRFYFLHSYEIRCDDPRAVTATSVYGERFVCAVQRDNLHGVQFHPEKSHGAGLRLLSRFARTTT